MQLLPDSITQEEFDKQIIDKLGIDTLIQDDKFAKQEIERFKQKQARNLHEINKMQSSEMDRLKKFSKNKGNDDEFTQV